VAYLQWTLVAVALVFWLLDRYSLRQLTVIWSTIFASGIIAAIPVGDIQLFGFPWGILGQLSITSTILVMLYVYHHASGGKGSTSAGELGYLLVVVSIWAIVFYPLALGVSMIDPYQWGYDAAELTGGLVLVSIYLWVRGLRTTAWIVVAGLVAHEIRLLESDNLWDYLFDPLLVIYAWSLGIRAGYRRLRTRTGKTGETIHHT